MLTVLLSSILFFEKYSSLNYYYLIHKIVEFMAKYLIQNSKFKILLHAGWELII
jgi:hypothetical protein